MSSARERKKERKRGSKERRKKERTRLYVNLEFADVHHTKIV